MKEEPGCKRETGAGSMKNIKIILEYDGTRYDGWQKQGNTGDTIQGKLEGILEKWAGAPVEVHGSGRTDAGVHAKGQTANFHISETVCTSTKEAMDYLNRYLPEDIRVLSAKEMPERFHSRLSAKSKTYEYFVETSDRKGVFERKYVYGLGRKLDLEAMREAASLLTGEHDFRSFCSNKKMKKSTVRNLESITIREEGSKVVLLFKGDGFLYNMVRILTGTLLEVGTGARRPAEMAEILTACDRSRAGVTAPSEGLFLLQVDYE